MTAIRKSLEVFSDFDGTITIKDTLDHIFPKLGGAASVALDERWACGEIGSKECLTLQMPLLKGGWPAIENELKEVKLDPTFLPFAHWLKELSVPLVVVSDGLDMIIKHILEKFGVTALGLVQEVRSNRLSLMPGNELSVSFPFAATTRECPGGTCKCTALGESAQERYRVVIGDGLSDRCWAKEADLLFAKGKLFEFCQDKNIPCTPWQDFSDIRRALLQKPFLFT